MTYPSTNETVAEQYHARILRGVEQMPAEGAMREENEEHRAFREAAQRGALAYAGLLREIIDDGEVTDDHLTEADLVATAATCAGWIGTSGAVAGRMEAMNRLIAGGYFKYYPGVDRKYVPCYRLVG